MDIPSNSMTIKNKTRATKIMELLADDEHNYTFTEIAQQLNITRRQLYNIMARDDIMELMHRDFLEREATHLDHIDQLWNSKSPTDKRQAVNIEEKRQKRIQDKIMPTLTQTQKIVTDPDLQKYKQHLETLTQAINQLPPNTKKQIWDNYEQIEQTKPP